METEREGRDFARYRFRPPGASAGRRKKSILPSFIVPFFPPSHIFSSLPFLLFCLATSTSFLPLSHFAFLPFCLSAILPFCQLPEPGQKLAFLLWILFCFLALTALGLCIIAKVMLTSSPPKQHRPGSSQPLPLQKQPTFTPAVHTGLSGFKC